MVHTTLNIITLQDEMSGYSHQAWPVMWSSDTYECVVLQFKPRPFAFALMTCSVQLMSTVDGHLCLLLYIE